PGLAPGAGAEACPWARRARICLPDALPDPAAEHAVRADRGRADGGRCRLAGERLARPADHPRAVPDRAAGAGPGVRVGPGRGAGVPPVLLCPPVPETAVEFDPILGRLLAPWLATREPLYRAELSDADGVVRRYAIYCLSSSEPGAEGSRAFSSLPPCGGGPG